jgi:hypothetical protein
MKIDILPPDMSGMAPPYANSAFVYANTPNDVVIVFMRIPLINDEMFNVLTANGTKDGKICGVLVSSVTLPRQYAVGFASMLNDITSYPRVIFNE